MSEETSVAFPVKWDISNVGAKKFYDRCKDFVETEDDFYELTKTSPFYHSINGVAIVYFEKYTCYVHHLLSGIGYALYFWSIVFIIIKYYKYYYVSQVAYIKNFLEFTENENKDKLLNKKYLFKPFYTSVTTSSALKGLACYVAFNMALSTVLRYTNDAIGSKGFCVGGYI
ncbi:hypothetical protein BCR32DRAFT_248000 [Anaeromyces robustus]|uniref:Uncharacterized protein n=1 Tax=Anaeromyces robustus TaxID=1754192 RepID=A0A1Y1WUZ1_9FUNG|nr:hypothetical protein BCR32DRAFT_248000 [Anaeromyces robustus]|eukprot:ORX77379.1 hypothetical protein BCR32DRAFT_248000 [Anaeromyces robustus]